MSAGDSSFNISGANMHFIRQFWIHFLLVSAPAIASASNDACSQDRIRFCEGKSGQQCLKDRISELSAGCKKMLEAGSVGKLSGVKAQAIGKAANIKTACSTEIGSMCADVALVGGGLNKCLRKNYDKLSAGCQKAVDQSKGGKS